MFSSFSQSAISKRLDKVLGKGRIRGGLKGEAPNFLRITVSQRGDVSAADEDYILSRIKDSLIALSRTGDIDAEFLALVEFDRRYSRRIVFPHGDMDIQAERRSPDNIEAVLDEEANRIANGLIRIIRHPENYITISTPSGDTIRTGSQILIGRSPECDIAIGDTTVGSHHAAVSWSPEDESWYLIDLGSVNGTVVDGMQLRNSQAKLAEGSAIVIARRHTLTVTSIEDLRMEPIDASIPQPGYRREVAYDEGPIGADLVEEVEAAAEDEIAYERETDSDARLDDDTLAQSGKTDVLPDIPSTLDESQIPTTKMR